jgi:light-regulated signal transduction histidine kinase (bacteriophytochrome)
VARHLASRELLRYVDATGVAVLVAGMLHSAGFVPAHSDIKRLMHWLDGVDRPIFRDR